MPEGKRLHEELHTLLDQATVQQAKSSAQHRAASRISHQQTSPREVSVHQAPGCNRDASQVPVRARRDEDQDVRPPADDRWRNQDDEDREPEARRGRHPHRGGRYDVGEDQDPSPEPMGPRCFSTNINTTRIPSRFRPLSYIPMYDGETNPGL